MSISVPYKHFKPGDRNKPVNYFYNKLKTFIINSVAGYLGKNTSVLLIIKDIALPNEYKSTKYNTVARD